MAKNGAGNSGHNVQRRNQRSNKNIKGNEEDITRDEEEEEEELAIEFDEDSEEDDDHEVDTQQDGNVDDESNQDDNEHDGNDEEGVDEQDEQQKLASEETHDGNGSTNKKQRKVHKLSLTTTEDFNEKLRKRGVLYVARIPPRMTPTKLKSLLNEFGVVTRVYLTEEDVTVRKRRRKVGGSGSKRYVEGWVEMEDKRVAKRVAASLNNTPITNYKRSVHYGDLWNLKYLHQFKWSHLTEKVAYERRVREQKLRVEMMQARRENAAYSQLVETGQKIDKIEARLERKRQQTKSADDKGTSSTTVKNAKDNRGEGPSPKKQRTHHQAKPLDEGTGMAAKHAVLTSLL